MATVFDPARARDVAHLARALTAPVGTQPTLHELVEQARRLVPAQWAAALVTERITTTPAALAATTAEEVTDVVARIAAAAGTSPGWTSFEEGVVCQVPDLTAEDRFGSYGPEMVAHTPIRSVLSVPVAGRSGVLGVLTVYADRPQAFGRHEVERAAVLGTLAGVALDTARVHDRALNLERALASSRTIGAAVGVLVERHHLVEDQAFELLRVASQLSNRKLADVASDLVRTGELAEEDRAMARVAEDQQAEEDAARAGA